ncbi:hypothetical protein Cfor_08337 [Coptotermes formosanus]|uniref:GPI-anchor transamidase n=1 Tax=Coptotermes formosanus TaxID=36987 RepID=A0A6L2Q935_COPFO|nr:hypothetical protein Cfor_08337 [Coptotermes formosanus]
MGVTHSRQLSDLFGLSYSQIILMVADDMACNPRNPRPATVFNNANQHINVYGDDVEVDYRGYEVTVENFVRLLTGRLPPGTPRSKQLLTDEGSNVVVYLTGHGGDGFLKFQDSEEWLLWILLCRYHEMFFMIDTCQAASLYEKFYSPNILAVASSLVGEDSLSHHVDPAIGVYIIDRYTYYALDFLERVEPDSTKTMGEFLAVCPKRVCISTVGVRKDLFRRDPHKVLITDFFGSLRPVELTLSGLNVTALSRTQHQSRRYLSTDSNSMYQKELLKLPAHKPHIIHSDTSSHNADIMALIMHETFSMPLPFDAGIANPLVPC